MKGWIFLLPGTSLHAVLAGWAAVPGLLGLLGELKPGSGKPAGAALLPPKQGSGSAPVPGIVSYSLSLGQAMGRQKLLPSGLHDQTALGESRVKVRAQSVHSGVLRVAGAPPCPASAPRQLCAILSSSWKQKLSSGPSLLPARPTVLST